MGESQTINTTGSPKYRSAIGAVFTPPFAPGTVLHNVNMMTGQPVYSVPIGQISMGRASYAFGYSYSGSVRQLFDADNERGPTSWIGYGWNFSTPFVSTYHKGTVNTEDDVFYCNLGQYGGGQLLQASSLKFYLASDPAIRVQANTNSEGLIGSWEFIFTDGVRMRFGSTIAGDKAERLVNRSGGSILASPYTVTTPTSLIYRWDLSTIDSKAFGAAVAERLEFRYDRFDFPIAGGVYYTRESYIREIAAINAAGTEVEKYRFTTQPKPADECPIITQERIVAQSQIETRYLSMVEWFPTASASPQKRFTNITIAQTPSIYKKRFLDGITIEHRTAAGTYVADPGGNWNFTYDAAANRHFGLKTMVRGIQKEEFVYGRPDYSLPAFTERTQQEASRNLLTVSSTDVQPPTGENFSAWENQSSCSDKFCFIAAMQNSPALGQYAINAEVWKNNGNYFELAGLAASKFRLKAMSTYPNSIQVIPWNDNFIILDSKAKQFTLYEWDGETFQANTNIIKRKPVGGTLAPITPNLNSKPSRIILGGDFFLVQDDGFKDACSGNASQTTSKVYVIKKINGVWKDLNENECTDPSEASPTNLNGCVTSHFSFGPQYNRFDGTRCLDFSASSLHISASQSMFHIVHQTSRVILSFAQSADGKTFYSISKKYPNFDGSVHQTNPNVRKYDVTMPILSGSDYFLVVSNSGSQIGTRVDMFNYNGTDIKYVNSFVDPAGTMKTWNKVWAGADYFLALKSTGELILNRKSVSPATGTPTSMTLTAYSVKTGVGINNDLRVRTHPNAFSIEEYPAGSLTNLNQQKPPLVVSSNYQTNLWEFDPALITSSGKPFRDITASFREAGPPVRNYYDVVFSDNGIVARSCFNATSTFCSGAAGDQVKFVTAAITPGFAVSGGLAIRKIKDVYHPWGAATYSHSQIGMSTASRIAVVSMLNEASKKVEFRLLQSMGEGYTQYPYQMGAGPYSGDINFVGAFKQYSALTGNNRGHLNEYLFYYIPDSKNIIDQKPEYNALLQSFSFPASAAVTYKGSEEQLTPMAIKMETVSHIADEVNNSIPDPYLGKVGLLVKSRVHDIDGVKLSESIKDELARNESEYYPPSHESVWPDKLFAIRLKKATSTTFSSNRSYQTKVTAFNRYNPNNNQPIFSKSKVEGKWYLNQTLFSMTGENKTLSTGSYAFRFDTEPSDANLDGWTDFTIPYNKDGAATKTISAGKVEYDATFPYLPKKNKVWRDADPTLDDDELKRGVDPIYSNGMGWEDRNVVEKRNGYGQPTETRVVLSESPAVSRYTANFYEGSRSMLAGTVDNCYLEDALVMTSENGGSSVSHTGKYGMALSAGPTVVGQVNLRGGSTLVNDYVVSVWMQSITTTHPVLTIKRFQKVIVNGVATYQEKGTPFTVSDPIGPTFATGKWQRYEKRLTVAQLKGSENLFATIGSGDYLQIILSVPSGSAYADNVLARPVASIATLNAYDFMGRLIHTIDNNHFLKSIDYDAFGRVSAVRDDRHRIYSSQATHNPGEND